MTEYKFFALRYIHDAVTGEFANVGIVLYSENAKVLKLKFTTQHRRLSGVFGAIDGDGFRSAVRYIQSKLDAAAEEIGSSVFPGGNHWNRIEPVSFNADPPFRRSPSAPSA